MVFFIILIVFFATLKVVAPFVGVWIEIMASIGLTSSTKTTLTSAERGVN